jgi:hypothetical protein
MGNYRYVGNSGSEIRNPNYSFTRFGQLVSLPDEVAARAISCGVPLVVVEDFDAIGFTEQELKDVQYPSRHTEEFKSKRKEVWGKLTPANFSAPNFVSADTPPEVI